MNRRELVVSGLGAGLALAMTTVAEAAPKAKAPAKKVDPRTALLASLATCLAKAALCDAHCAAQLAAGSKEFARCSASVRDMIAIGQATQSLVARGSASAKTLVDLCAAACKECSAACLEHKEHWSHGMHVECKECMDACDACLKACMAYTAA